MRSARTLIPLAAFILFVALGLLIAQTYGASWDELAMRKIGIGQLEYALTGHSDLLTHVEGVYGPLFEMILAGLERVLNLQTMHAVFVMRHMVSFLMFAVGVCVFYFLCTRHFKSTMMGYLGAILLITSPRIWGDAFVNSKDIPAMALMIIAIHAIVRWMDKQTWGRVAWAGVASALMIDVRLTGILLPFLLVAASIPLAERSLTYSWRRHAIILLQICASLAITGCVMVLFWPWLWQNPIAHFGTALSAMSHYPWPGKNYYAGMYIAGSAVPWHYPLLWIVVTTPLITVFFGVIGIAAAIVRIVKGKLSSQKNHETLLFLLWFILPLAAVIFLQSVLYDGWRQLFFIYPAFILLALETVDAARTRIARTACVALLIFSIVTTGFWMIRNHPYQNAYFSISGAAVRESFDLDYWGVSYKQGLEWLAKHDSSNEVTVDFLNLPGQLNLWMLPEETFNRFIFQEKTGRYFITNFRGHYGETVTGKEIHSIVIDGAKILGIYER